MKTIFGYELEETGNERIPYHAIGKRGAIYSLVRRVGNESSLFVINRNGNICSLKGNYNFTDKNGEVEVVNF